MLFTIMLMALVIIIPVFLAILAKKEKQKSELLQFIAHKLRSSNSTIKWYIELLSDKSAGNLSNKQKEYLNEITKASEKLNENINSILQEQKIKKVLQHHQSYLQ